MYVVCVTIFVKKGHEEAFIAASRLNHEGTRKEIGNLRFDVLRCEDDPCKFFLYEVYKTKDDFVSHKQTPHYAEWKASVAPWMAEPRQCVKYLSLFPANETSKWNSNT